ncbi:hypothetical protein, partial [Novipirellula caenicola]|uniref:beta strand repeat-containing protein n=1 Tax=Novipirellula caenicola TaxID=1536901 RepID=UPI0031F08144
MSLRRNSNLSGTSLNRLSRVEKLRQRVRRWSDRLESRRQSWAEKRAARLERFREAFRGAWLAKIGLGLMAIVRMITDPPFIVRIEKRPAVPYTAMLPWLFSFERKTDRRRRPRFASTQQAGVTVETLERRELLAADITGIGESEDFADIAGVTADTASTNDLTPTITGTATAGSTVYVDGIETFVDVGNDASDGNASDGLGSWTFTPSAQITHGQTFSVMEGATGATSFTAHDAVTISYEASVDVAVGESIQHAINNLPSIGGTINLAAGTFTENLVISKPVNIVGATGVGGNATTTLQASSGNVINITGASFPANADVAISNVNLDGQNTANIGLRIDGNANVSSVSLDNGSVENFKSQGFYLGASAYNGSDPSVSAIVDSVTLTNLDFANNGINGSGGQGDIQFFGYNNNATLSNLSLVGNRVESPSSSGAQLGIQFRGVGAGDGTGVSPSGTIALSDIDVSGKYRTQMIGIQRYSDVSGLSFNGVELGGGSSEITGGWGSALRFDGVGTGSVAPPTSVDLGNTLFRGISGSGVYDLEFAPDNGFAFLRADATGTRWTIGGFDIDASSLTAPDALAIEARILHYPDKLHPTHGSTFGAYKGFAEVVSDKVYVTSTGSIARAVEMLPAGGTIVTATGTQAVDGSGNLDIPANESEAADLIASVIDSEIASTPIGVTPKLTLTAAGGSLQNLLTAVQAKTGVTNQVEIQVKATANEAANLTAEAPPNVNVVLDLGTQEIGASDDSPAITISGGNVTVTGGTLKKSTGTSPTLAVNAGTLAITGSLAASGGDIHVSSGGKLVVNGAVTGAGSLTVDGTLAGSGTINGNVNIPSDGVHAPGNSPGTTTVNGNYTLSGALDVEIISPYTTPGAAAPATGGDYDKIIVTGDVDLTNGSLNLIGGATADVDTEIMTIIDNQGPNPITGTFSGLAEGAVVAIDNFTGRISYVGGTGNDVVIYADSVVPTLDSKYYQDGDYEDTTLTKTYNELLVELSAADNSGVVALKIQSIANGTVAFTQGSGDAVLDDTLKPGNSLTWTPTANLYGENLEAFTVVAIDAAGNESSAETVTVELTASNDAPFIAFNNIPVANNESADAQTTAEDTPLVFNDTNANRLTIGDVDTSSPGADSPRFLLKIEVTAGAGEISVANVDSTVTGDGSTTVYINGGSGTVTGTSTIANINSKLNGLTFTPTENWNGLATLTLTINDDGYHGDGSDSLESTITIPITVTNVAPAIVAVSGPIDGNYKADDILEFTVNYDESVVVDTSGGVPSIAVTIGSATVQAFYDPSSSTTTALKFRYTVLNGQTDTDGIGIGSVIDLNGGTIKDAGGANADLDFTTPTNETPTLINVLVDTTQPSVSTVAFDDANDLVTEGDIPGTVTLTVTFDEAMDTGVAPVIATNAGTTLTSPTNGQWTDSTTYTLDFTVADADVELADVLVDVSGAQDVAGNTMVAETGISSGTEVDTVAPATVTVNASFGDPLINEADDTATVTLTVNFSEAMDTGVAPVIATNAGTTLTSPTNGQWTDSTTYTLDFTVADANVELADVLVDVSGAQDVAGNTMVAETGISSGTEVDTVAPATVTVNASFGDPLINEADDTATVTLTVNFSEAMDTGVAPVIATNAGTTLTSPTNGQWTDSTTYTLDFTVADANVELADVLVDVSGAQDVAGNTMVAETGISSGTEVDTVAPAVLSVEVDTDLVYEGDLVQQVTVTFDEAMDTSTVPNITFSTGSWSPVAVGTWSMGDTVFTRSFTLVDGDEEENGVTVDVTGSKDIAGNDQEPYSVEPEFDIDTLAPTVVSIVRTGAADANPTLAASVDFLVTFSEPIDATTVAIGDFELGGTSIPTGAAISSVTPTTGVSSTFTVTVSTGTGDGTIDLNVKTTDGLADVAGNVIANGTAPTDETYTIATTKLELDGLGNLLITDVRAASNDKLKLSVDGGNLVIEDTNVSPLPIGLASVGFTRDVTTPASKVTIPLTSITGKIILSMENGDSTDEVTLVGNATKAVVGTVDVVKIDASSTLTVNGVLTSRIEGASVSAQVVTSGNATVGNGTDTGFETAGSVVVNSAHTLTILDTNGAILGNSTTVTGEINAAGGLRLGSGKVLSGNGTVTGQIITNSGTVDPTGTLTLNSGADFDTGKLKIDITSQSTYDTLLATSPTVTTVALGSETATLQLDLTGATIVAGNAFKIIDVAGSATRTGTFAGLPEGTVLTNANSGWTSGLTARITYAGGDGNDVVIVVDGPVTIAGTANNDAIQVVRVGENVAVKVNGTTIDSRPLASLAGTGQSLTINGGNGDDTFTVDFSGGNPLPAGGLIVNGQGHDTPLPGDVLNVVGLAGQYATHTYNYTNANDGSVGFSVGTGIGYAGANRLITYTGLEPITNTGTATNAIFNLPSLVDNTDAMLTQSGSNLILSGSTFENTTISTTSLTSLTINGGTKADSLTLNAMSLAANVNINLGANDTITLAGTLTTTGTGTVTLAAQSITTANAGANISSQGAVNITGSGAGSVTLNTIQANAANVTIAAGSGGLVFDKIEGTSGGAAPTNVSLTSQGLIESKTLILAASTLSANAVGNITLDQINPAINVPVTLTSSTGSVKSEAGLATGYINASNLTINSNAGTNVRTNAGTLTVANTGASVTGDVIVNQVIGTTLTINNMSNMASGYAIDVSGEGSIAKGLGGSITATNGLVTMTSKDIISINATVQTSGAGNIVISARESVAISGTGAIGTLGTGTIIIDSDYDGLGFGDFTNSGLISTANATDNAIRITASSMGLSGTISSVNGRTTLRNSQANQLISLGATFGGDIVLSNAELATITAESIEIGRNDSGSESGAISISNPITISPSKSNTLILKTGSTITDTIPGRLTVTNLKLAAADSVLLVGDNDVDELVAIVSGTGSSFEFRDIDDVTIPASPGIDGTTGITTANGNVTLVQNDLAILSAVNAGTANVVIRPYTDTRAISLGAETAGQLSLTDTELDFVTAAIVKIGQLDPTETAKAINTGNINLRGAINQPKTGFSYGTLSLITGGAVLDQTGTDTADITVNNLAIQTGAGIGTNGEDIDVTVGTLAAHNDMTNALVAGSAIHINNLGNVQINTVDGVIGVANNASGGMVEIDVDADGSDAGILTVNRNVSATNGAITLTADDDIIFDVVTVSNGASAAGNPITITADTVALPLNNGGVVTMVDGTVINSGASKAAISADGNITLGLVQSTSNTADSITLTTTSGAVLDANEGTTNTDLMSAGGVVINAASGVGIVGNPIETSVGSLDITNADGVINILEANHVSITRIDQNGTDDDDDVTIVTADGTITVDGAITSSGITADGGDIVLTAGGSGQSINIYKAVSTLLNGKITLTAAENIASTSVITSASGKIKLIATGGNATFSASGDITSTSGDIEVTANDTGAVITQSDGSLFDAGSGTILLAANGNISLSGLKTTHINNTVPTLAAAAVTITTTTGNIIDNGDTVFAGNPVGGLDIDAANGRLVMTATSGSIGAGNPLEIDVFSIDATAGVGDLQVIDSNDIYIDQLTATTGNISVESTGGSINDLQDDATADLSAPGVGKTITLKAQDEIGGMPFTTGGDTRLELAAGSVVTAKSLTSGNVLLHGIGALNLTDVTTASGSISVTADGTINATNVVATSGSVGLTAAGATSDIFGGTIKAAGSTVSLSAGRHITAPAGDIEANLLFAIAGGDVNVKTNVVDVQSQSGGATTINELNAINIISLTAATSLVLSAGSNVTDSGVGVISAGNDATISSSGGTIVLNDNAADMITIGGNAKFNGGSIDVGPAGTFNAGTLSFTSSGAVTIQEDSAMEIAGVNTSGNLSLTSAGAITDDDSAATTIAVTGDATLIATGAITLGESADDVLTATGNTNLSGSAITVGVDGTFNTNTLTFNSAGAVTIQEDSDTEIAGVNTSGNLSLTSAGAITD